MTDEFLAALGAALPSDALVTDPGVLEQYSHDDAEWAPFGAPAALVHASSVDQVVVAVRIAAEHRVSVVPRGAGTGLSGGANATTGCLLLSLQRMTRVIEVNAVERYAVVQAGVLNDDLRRRVAEDGLWYPPDPASQAICTIGGNVATNAGGICCVKYGVTRDYVIGMTVVLADGSIARIGRTTAKGATGYDLTGLMVGSEGTLGVIVEVTVKLLPLTGREERGIIASFGSLTDAGRAVAAITGAGIVPAALELIDRTCMHAVSQWKGWDLPDSANAMLLVSVDDVGERGDELAEAVQKHCEQAGGFDLGVSLGGAETERLFAARRLAYPALERLGPVLTEDVCVPRSAVPEMLARIERAAQDNDVIIANIAHAGDGNLHPLIIVPDGDEAAKARAKVAFDSIVDDCRALGGTVTGEHGVGLLKLPGAAAELSPTVLRMHHAIKSALDPHGIMNPGKAFPEL